ncbi:unnamed protein product, partial [Urochloa humidicola]
VGVDDEPIERTSNNVPDYIPDSEEEDNDDCAVDDEKDCEPVEHITDLENPKIAVGVTFEDRDTFMRAIRQYAILNEVEIAAPYNEAKRYKAFCKGKKCKWTIHASQLQDGRTWMIKKMPNKHYCMSTSKVKNNCMANQFWVRDRVIQWLRQDPTIGASALKNKLEEKYLIKLSYWIVYNGRQLALDEILGKWEDSFEYAFQFKAEIERKSPGSIVEIDYEKVGSKIRFSRMFVALKPCIDGFKNGCRPYLGIDSTALTGRWKGQLASAIGVDGHNWMFPVAYGVFGSETEANWGWFMSKLAMAIGSPPGLVISTDAGKGIDLAVTKVFTNGVEHRECMRHLYKNFKKKYRGKVFEKNLWPAARAYRKDIFDNHYNIIKASSTNAMQWIEKNHKHLWARCYFYTASKCDYVTNNIAEAFNNWIKHEKSLPVIELMDRIRQKIMEKLFQRRSLAMKLNTKVLPHIIKALNAKSRQQFGYSIHKGIGHLAEISGVYKDLTPWRHSVNLEQRTCSCKKWQLTGLPCNHAISLICSYRGLELEDFVHSCYSVSKFKAVYEGWIEPIPDKTLWPQVHLGFKLWPPVLKRAAGRPRTRRIKAADEGGSKKMKQCKRCGQFGHMQKTYNETVYDSDAPPPAPPKPKRKRTKKREEVAGSPSTPKRKRTEKNEVPGSPSTSKRKRTKKPVITTLAANPSTPLRLQHAPATPSSPFDLNCSPGALTRSRARKLEVEEAEVHGRMALEHLMDF